MHTIESIKSELEELALQAQLMSVGQEISADIAGVMRVRIHELRPTPRGRSRKIYVECIPNMWDLSVDFYAGDSINVPTWPHLPQWAFNLVQKYNPALLFIPQWNEEEGEYSDGDYVSLQPHKGVTSWGEEYEVLDDNHFVWLSEPNEVHNIKEQFAPAGWQCAKRLEVW